MKEQLSKEQVRKGGLPPLMRERGQATLPDLFFFPAETWRLA
jgi:hypothetical protein